MNPTLVWLRVVSAISVVCGAGMLSAQAEGWDGNLIGVQYLQPDQETVFLNEGPVQVVGTVELPTAFGVFSIDLAPTQITIMALGEFSPDVAAFAGFRFSDASNLAQSLVTASINGASTITPTGFGYDADNIYVNLSGLSLAANQSVIIDLNFVPESSTWAAGLVALPVAGMWLRRRSSRR